MTEKKKLIKKKGAKKHLVIKTFVLCEKKEKRRRCIKGPKHFRCGKYNKTKKNHRFAKGGGRKKAVSFVSGQIFFVYKKVCMLCTVFCILRSRSAIVYQSRLLRN